MNDEIERQYPGLSEDFLKKYASRVAKFSSSDRYFGELDVLFKYLPMEKGHHFLDIGCGTANAIRYFEEKSGASGEGIDIIPEYIQLSQLPGKTRIADAHTIPYSDEVFDAVISIHAIGHYRDAARVLREAYRVTKPGGYFGIITPNRHFVMSFRPLNMVGIIPYTLDPTRRRMYTQNGLRQELEETGWRVEKIFRYGKAPGHLSFLPRFLRNLFSERIIAVAKKI